MGRRLPTRLLCLVFVGWCLGGGARTGAEPRERIVLVSLDGMADWILDELLAAGEMPNLARLIAQGGIADHAVTTFPAKTAVAHATLWTGTDPSRHGVHGNATLPVPYRRHDLLDRVSGFTAEPLQAEPIWAAAARQGRRVVVVQATQSYPFARYLGPRASFPAPAERLLLFDGYEGELLGTQTLRPAALAKPARDWQWLPPHRGQPTALSHRVGDLELQLLLFDDPQDPTSGPDTLWICARRDGRSRLATLAPLPPDPGSTAGFSPPLEATVEGRATRVYFRLFALGPQADEWALFQSRTYEQLASDPRQAARLIEAAGGFVGNGGLDAYRRGAFGRPLLDLADAHEHERGVATGGAERAYVETVRHAAERLAAAMAFCLTQYDWDLLIGYLPFPDGPNHAWIGEAGPPIGSRDSALGRRLRRHLLAAYGVVDDYVGVVLEHAPEGTVLMVTSDHGFVGTGRTFRPNVALREAGLLALTAGGVVDLAATRILYRPAGSGFLLANDHRFAAGIVAPGKRGEVLEQARRALLAVADDGGRRPVLRVLPPAMLHGLGMSGPYAGDLYLELAPGYASDDDARHPQVVSRRPVKTGEHFGDPRRRLMQAIFAVARPGGGAFDLELGEMRAIDVAPTASAVLGIEPPRHATGRAREDLVAALAKQRQAMTP